ncbi:MAG: prepilin-type N-terminal cleavage/methylation domain-containing protein [Candidatus Pacebacteria bacterium]|nr:prepilin-type N-terminal cleavage/methylation domain-containing protein [Candidatus Paceibacterota bacterium]
MKNKKRNKSFTLIELLVVIIIIGVIAGLITVGVFSFVTTSQNTKMVAQLGSLGTAFLCLEDSVNNSNFLSYYGIQTIPSNPNYGTDGTNNSINNK